MATPTPRRNIDAKPPGCTGALRWYRRALGSASGEARDADGYFPIPADGAYQISFDPMSMVGAPGVMIVCTL